MSHPSRDGARQRGLTLVEALPWIVGGIIVVGGIITLVVSVKNSVNSAANLLVQVPAVHGTGSDDFDVLEPGDAQLYESGREDLTSVTVKPGFDFSRVKRVAVVSFSDYPRLAGSGEIVTGAFEQALLAAGICAAMSLLWVELLRRWEMTRGK